MLSRLRPRRREELPDPSSPGNSGAADLGAQVLAYLHAHGIPSAPRYYALVHTALTDRTSIAAHAIAEATDNAPMSHEVADAILAAMSGGTVENAEEHERLRHQTLHLADLAADAAAATNRFGRDLSAGLGDVESDVRSVTAVLSSMLERTRATEARLAAAVEEIEHLRDEVAEARNDAARDELTGLLNRRGVIEHIAGLDPSHPRTIAVCDIDSFKMVNDSHGHEVGDRVLKVVASTLAEGCAPHLVGRWGGEEFIVVLDEADPARAAEIIDTVRETLGYRALRVRETGESLGRVTFSAGVAAFNPPPSIRRCASPTACSIRPSWPGGTACSPIVRRPARPEPHLVIACPEAHIPAAVRCVSRAPHDTGDSMAQHLNYRENAAQARRDADAATLDNVRERCLRAEAAWLDMAVRQERVATARAEREAPRTVVELA